jgi:glycosyltransferase involved in cell wall biosynthesis
MAKVKSSFLGTNGLPAQYGGFETLVNNLTKELSGKLEIEVFCGKTPESSRLETFNGAKLRYINLNANGIQSIPYDILSLILSWFKSDSILLLGTPGSIVIPLLKVIQSKTKIITNFGGLEWERDKWGFFAKKYLKLSESIAVRFSDLIVADNQAFVDYIMKEYGKKSKLIEYGGDHVTKRLLSSSIKKKYPFVNESYSISVSRAQPDNNLHVVLEAFKMCPERRLVLVSNWNSFQYGKDLKEKYKDVSNIHMQNAIYDQEELDTLRSNAELYIHSHSFCGTAPSLVEAMCLGLPVISFKADTNVFTTENKAMYFKDETELTKLICSINEKILTENSLNMQEIANRRYTWKHISDKYLDVLIT